MQNATILPCASWRLLVMATMMVTFGAVLPGTRSHAQQAPPPAEQTQSKAFSIERLEQLAAPIALYPDALMSQVLMASTYPLEVVQAARWVGANPKVAGKALEDAMQSQPWDASVKSLTTFPSVLQMMNDKLDWTQQLGDAFLGQQKELLAAVQSLRQRADKSGNLKTTKEQKVTKTESGSQTYYVIEPQSPTAVYVPAYNPSVVYGSWPYPAYPPYAYYPPGYVAGSALWFGAGVVAGAALWGNCNWGRNEVNVNVERYNQFNRTNISNSNWQHNVEHRKGVPYSNANVANQYKNAAQDAASREQYRGRAEAGRQDLKAPSTQQAARQATQQRPAQQPAGTNARSQTGEKAKSAQPMQQKQAAQGGQRQPSAFDGAGSGSQVKKESARGQQSRTASQAGHAARQAPAAGRSGGGGGGGGRGR